MDPKARQTDEQNVATWDEMMERISHAISHDLREPLIIIQQFTEMLIAEYGEKLDSQGCDWLERIHRNARRSQQMIQALRDMWALQVDRSRMQSTDMVQLIRRVVREIEWEGRVLLECENDCSPMVWTEPVLLERVIREVVRNAVQHGKRELVTLTIQATERDESIEVELRDNGFGISPALRSQIPKLFMTSDSVNYVGAGLTIVQRIMQLHGGRLHLTSTSDGACVRLVWPVAG